MIDYAVTEKGNLRVTSDSIDFYRYFDATPHVEFLYECVADALEKELPDELRYLRHRDAFHSAIDDIVDMPERTLDLLLGFLRQNRGVLSKRAREREFAALTDDEVTLIEATYSRIVAA